MAKTFQRFPIVGGDLNQWGTILNTLREQNIGLISSKLYNSGGSLYVSAGKIGIDDGTYKAAIDITVAETVSISGVSNGNWALVEVYISGTTVTIAATDISGATDENEIPSNFTGSYNPIKGGYYSTSSRRTLGIVWKTSGGDLGKVISCLSFENFAGGDIVGINDRISKINIAEFSLTSGDVTISSASPTYTVVPLDNEDYNTIKDCYLTTSGTIMLPAGTYKILINSQTAQSGGGVGLFYQELYNVTDSAQIRAGHENVFNSAYNLTLSSFNISLMLTVDSSKEIAVRAAISGGGSNALVNSRDSVSGGLNAVIEKLDGE